MARQTPRRLRRRLDPRRLSRGSRLVPRRARRAPRPSIRQTRPTARERRVCIDGEPQGQARPARPTGQEAYPQRGRERY